MKVYCSYTGTAWLLSRDGQEIPVLHHPSESFEFESIVDIVAEHGTSVERAVAEQYMQKPDDSLKAQLLSIYAENWCKVRTWGTFHEEVTFRITSIGFDWYFVVVEFLLRHKEFQNSEITVESDKASGSRKLYWNRIPYQDAIDAANEFVLASQLTDTDLICL